MIFSSILSTLSNNRKKYNGIIKANEADTFDYWINMYYTTIVRPIHKAEIKESYRLKLLLPMELNIKFEIQDIGDYTSKMRKL
jgi:hypothetical protein